MFRTIGKVIILLCLGLIVGYCFVLYVDLRSYAVLKNLELQSKGSVTERYHDYQWNPDNIFVFMQLSDIHVSLFRDPARVPDLRRFLANELRLIRPDVVVVSGDLTDAKLPNYKASRQYEEEWKIYHGLLQEYNVDEVTKWLDLRGNHDTFNIVSLDDTGNFFAKYSKRGRDSQRSYMHTVRKPFGQYSFIAMDVVPTPGPKRPYNFFGFLDTTAVLDVQRFARKSKASNHSFWFGHYPLSIIVSQGFDVHKFLGQHAYSYMCGHLHTLGGSVPSMYGLHPEGFLELELGDWMDNRLYRLAAVDNDVVAFRDIQFGTWPAVLVTSPKDSRYLLPHKEPVAWLNRSLEIRVLAYSPDPIAFVKVWIDGGYLGNATPRRSGGVSGLFALPWQPSSYTRTGDRHQLEVTVRDASGRESHVRQEFSLSGRPNWQFGMLPSLILLGDVTKFLRLLFYTLWLGLFGPLIAGRVARYRFTDSLVQSVCSWFQPEITRGMYRFVLSDGLFYPWIVYFLYMGCGPLMFGYFVDNYFGVMFLNGLYIGGTWLPESFIYASEFVQMSAFHVPLVCLLCYRLGRHVARQPSQQRPSLLGLFRDCRYWIYPLLALQLWLSVNFLLATYDLSVFLLSPCRLWQVGFGWYLHRVVCRIENSILAHSHG